MRRLALLLLALAATAYKDPDGFVVAGYLPEWRYEGAHWESLAKHLTHLIFFSAEPKPDGTITGLDRLPRPELLKEARKAADENDLKLLVCFGGNGRSSGFAAMTGSDKSRKKFVENLAKLLEKKKLDGVDYNWEYPGHSFQTGYSEARISREWRGLKLLLEETRRALPDAVISVAYYPDGRQENLLAAASENADVNHFHAMAYDQHGKHHSTFAFAEQVVQNALSSNLDPSKCTLGLPFYGRHSDGRWETYEDLLKRGAAYHTDLDSVAPARDGETGGWAFNSPTAIVAKTKLARRRLGGVMVWEAGQDCRLGETRHRTSREVHVRTCGNDDDSLLVAVARGRAESSESEL
jgi:GH18 family chitinase